MSAFAALSAPHRSQARVHEAHDGTPAFLAKMRCTSTPSGARAAAEIVAEHRDAVALSGEQAREDRLLHVGAARERNVGIVRQHQPGGRRHKAQESTRQLAGLRASISIMPSRSNRLNSISGRRLDPVHAVTSSTTSAAAPPWKAHASPGWVGVGAERAEAAPHASRERQQRQPDEAHVEHLQVGVVGVRNEQHHPVPQRVGPHHRADAVAPDRALQGFRSGAQMPSIRPALTTFMSRNRSPW